MRRRLHALYLRYAAVHSDSLSSAPIGPIGRRVGNVERVERRGSNIGIEGWVHAEKLRLTWSDGEVSFAPDIARPDVAASRGLPVETGFSVRVPAEARQLVLWVERGDAEPLAVPLRHPSSPASPAAHRRLRRAFLRDLLRAMPDFARYLIAPSDRTRSAIKRALRLDIARRGHVLDGGWFAPPSEPRTLPQPLTIIVPVFNAFEMVKDCLARVDAHTDLPWSIIIVDDASTDPDIGPWLTAWAADRPGRATLLTQETNLGFVGAVNAGLAEVEAQDRGGAVVLLNSDAMVSEGWASRLIAPLSDPDVASVTPMSNAAEILSVPVMGPGAPLCEGEGDALAAIAHTFGPVPLTELPTGVGFCMAMATRWLAQIPRFDPAFGRGYGEEVDWCQKTAALGARHLGHAGVFVEHVGGQSFGNADKSERIKQANARISRRYPDYDGAVQDFMARDPLATPRLALGVALAGQRANPLPVYLAHSLGGGAEVALMAEIAGNAASVVLRIGGAFRWQVEAHVDGQVMAGQTDDFDLVRKMLSSAGPLRLIYSCGVGDRDPVALPKAFLSLRQSGAQDSVAMRIHDYFALSPSYTLLGTDGYRGVPESTSPDPAHIARRPDGSTATLSEWRSAWGRLVAASDEVRVFSQASGDIVQLVYPDAKVRLAPHDPPDVVRKVAPGDAKRIGILGNMNRQKGALVLSEAARLRPDLRFIIIGHSDSSIPMPRNVTVHGGYCPEEISELTESYRIGAWLMPAIWPETFSFATREALATGLPVVGFDLGAQGEALNAAQNGTTVSPEPAETMATRLLKALPTGD